MTGAKIHIFDWDADQHTHLVSLYQHGDGYPGGLGEQLKQYIKNSIVVNGYTPELLESWEDKHIHNGVGCFACNLISHLKVRIGHLYIATNNGTPAPYRVEPSYHSINRTYNEYFVYDITVSEFIGDNCSMTLDTYDIQMDKFEKDVARSDTSMFEVK